MSTTSFLTEEDIIVQDLYVANGKLKFKQYGEVFDADPLDRIPVYEKLREVVFSKPSLKDVAYTELTRITRKLIELGVKLEGEKDCAKHTGLFSGNVTVDPGKGVLVRLTERKQIRGKIGGTDGEYPGFVLVQSKATDGNTTLLPGVNYLIHGDYPTYPEDWVKILRDKNSFSQMTGLEAPVDVQLGKQLMFVDGKYKRQLERGTMYNPEASKRVRLVDVPEDRETMTVVCSDVFRNYSCAKMVIKAIKLCNRMGQRLEVSTIATISQQAIEIVIPVIVRCSSDLVGDIAVNGFMLGITNGDGATNFRNLTEVTFSQLRNTMVRLHDSDGLYVHRTMGAVKVDINGEIGHIESGTGAMAPYEGTVRWAG